MRGMNSVGQRVVGFAVLVVMSIATTAPVGAQQSTSEKSAPAKSTATKATAAKAASSGQAAGPASEKAMKYYSMLAARPEPGYLFDRFYNTWLDDSTVDALEAFLLKQVETSQKTQDRLLLAFFYAKKGDDVAALDAFRTALEHNPASAATWYHKALVEARTLDFDAAIADLKKAREQKPDEKLAILIDKQLGKLYARNRQTAEALKVWQTLLTANWNDDELVEDVVELLIEEGLFKEAAAFEEKLVARTKDQYLSVTRKLRLGDIYHRSGDRGKAVAAYTTALDAVGSDSWIEREILAQLDQVYRREDDLAGLKRLYGELLKKYEKRIAIQRRYAQLLVELGEQEPAIAAYRQIIKLTPGDRATREEFIGVLAKLGKQDEAIKELEALSTQYPKDAELRFRLASLYQEAKKPDQAVTATDKYLETSDGSEYAYLRAARLLERLDKKDAAVKLYDRMAQKFANSAAAQDAYAAFLYSAGKKKEAIERWSKLAASGDVAQMLQVARTLSTRNEYEAAYELLKGGLAKVKNDPLYLGQLVNAALALKKYDEAIPWSEDRVRLGDQPADLEAALDQAATVIERADKLEAEAQRLEKLEKRSVPETCLVAELLERSGNGDRADAALKQAADKGNLLALSEQIRLFSERKEWNRAAEATRKILELPGGRKTLHVRRLVELYQRDFQLEEGLKWIDEWKRLSPGSTTPWVTEVRMLQGLGHNDEALKVLRTAVLKFDQDEDLRVQLAELYVETDKPADAMRIYWQLYEETEDLTGKLRWAQKLAELAQSQGTVQKLVQDFDERVRTNRQSIVPLLALSEIYRVADDYEGRRRALVAAAKIKPDDIYLLQQIARVEEQDGDWRSAIATLERAAPLDKTTHTREQIAQLQLNFGNEETGFSMLYELAGGKDADPRTLETIADTLCGMHEWERAADFLQRRINDHPADYRLRYLLGVALEESNRTAEATQQFLQLMSGQEELPKKKQAGPNVSPAAMAGSYYDFIRQLIPSEALEWFELMQYRYSVYSYRQQQSAYVSIGRGAGSTGPRSNIQIPMKVDTVRLMAVTHLLGIANTLEEEKLNDLSKELESRGVKQAKALAKLDPMRGDFTGVLPELLEKDPKNETVLAILVMQGMGMRNESLSQYYPTALEIFRKSRPQLAFMCAIAAGIDQAKNSPPDEKAAKGNKYLDEALRLAATFDHPNPLLVMSLTSALGNRMFGGQDVQIGEGYRQKFSALLVKWYPELSKLPQFGPWVYYAASQSLSRNSDPAVFMQFLDDEVARSQTSAKGPNSRMQMIQYMGGRPTQLLVPMTFPPKQLADFPPHLLASFATGAENNSPFGEQQDVINEEAAKKIAPLLDKVKSPILRILFAHKAEQKERVDAELKKLLTAKTPVLDAYLLAASHAAENEKWTDAVQLLQKAQYLPMKQEVRRQVDASIVTAVQAAKAKAAAKNSKELAELLDAGQKAALRLRRAKLSPQERTELVAAMEELGLKKEAEKLDALANAAGAKNAFATPTASYSVNGWAQANSDQVAKLMEQGKRDAAVKQLAGEVTGLVRQQLSSPQNATFYRYQARETRKKVEGHGLADDVLKSLEPGDSKNAQKLIEYAMACQLFDRKKPAREALEKVLKDRPKEDMARMQLIMLLAPDDPQAAARLIPQLAKQSRDAFGQMISGMVQDSEASFEQRIGIVRLTTDLFKTMEPGDLNPQQSYWVENMMTVFGHSMGGRRGSLPSLYATKKPGRPEYPNQDEIMTERRKVHDELCRQMLKMPELARTGFRYLLASTEAQGKPVDEFAAEAERIITREAEARANRVIGSGQVYYNSGEAEVRMRSPEEFLAARAWKSNDWKLIDQTLLPKLTGAKNRATHDRLAQLTALYRCDESKYFAEAEKIIMQSRPSQPGQPSEGPAIAVDVWAERGLKTDLQPILVKQLKSDANSPYGYSAPSYVMRYLEGLAKTRSHADQLAFLEEVATVYLGPAEKRNDFIKKNYNRNSIQYGTPNGRIYSFGQFMEQICQNPALMFVALEHLEQYDEPKPVQNFQYRVQESIRQLQGKDPEAAMEMLKQSPWLQDLEHFRPLMFASGREVPPLGALLRVDTNNAEYQQKLREGIEAQQKAGGKTFGGEFILATLDQQKKPAALLEYVGSQMDAIKKLPEKRQEDLAALVRGLLPKSASMNDLSDAGKAAQTWIGGSSANQAQWMLVRLQKAKRLEEVGISDMQFQEFFTQNMGELIRSDPKSAVQVFMRICELSRDAQKRGQWNMYLSNGESLEGWLLDQMSYSIKPIDLSALAFYVQVVNNDKNKPIEVSYSLSNIGNQAFQAFQNGGQKQPGNTSADGNARIRRLYDELGKALDGQPSSLLMKFIYERFQNDLKNKTTNDKVREWTAKEMQGGKYPQLATDLNTLATLVSAEARRGPKAKREGAPRLTMMPYHERLCGTLKDEKLPLTWRMYVAKFLAEREQAVLPLEAAKDIAALYTQALDKGVPITDEQNSEFTRLIVSLANEKDAEAVVKGWREAWPRRYLGQKSGPRNGANQYESMNRLTNTNALCSALEVYLTGAGSEMPEQAKRLVSVYGDTIGYLPQTIAVLLRSHQPEEAAKTLRRSAPKLDITWPNNETTQYNDQIAKELPAMLEKLDRDDERYLAKVLFAAMPDPGQPARSGEELGEPATPRDQRLTKLAGEFKSVKFNDPVIKKLSLVFLSESNPAAKQILDDVAAAYDPARILSAISSDNSAQLTQETRLATCHLRNLLREGKTDAYVDLVKRMTGLPADDDYRFGMALSPLVDCALAALRDERTKPWSPEACAAVGEALAGALKDRQYLNINNFDNFSTLLGAMYGASKSEKINKGINNASDYLRSRFENSPAREEIWRIGLKLNGQPTPENLNARIQYLQNVMRFALERKWLTRNGTPYKLRNQSDRNYLGAVVRIGFIKGAELKASGAKALEGLGTKDEPTYGKAIFANWLQSEKDFEEAAEVWRSMIKIAPDAKKVSKNEANYVLGLAVCLKNLEKYDEALAALAMLEGKQFDSSLKGSFERYKRDVRAAKAGVKKTDASKPATEKSTRYTPVRGREVLVAGR